VKRWPIRLLGLVAFGALAAQAGHLLVYQLEFGSAAQAVQSQGAHDYFPLLAKTAFGVGAVGVLLSLLLIGIARLLPGRQVVVVSRGPSYLSLLSIIFTIQLLCFIAQETIESLLAGTTVTPALNLILLGSVGQLPVAIFAALALKWLAVRVSAALVALQAELALRLAVGAPTSLLQPAPALVPVPALAVTCPTIYIKRGPPAILRD
jgi:hypothetical protein